jgi:hypothetical protein
LFVGRGFSRDIQFRSSPGFSPWRMECVISARFSDTNSICETGLSTLNSQL